MVKVEVVKVAGVDRIVSEKKNLDGSVLIWNGEAWVDKLPTIHNERDIINALNKILNK